jgi:predicted dithiol-disulfide oxidoreductase (DUF899 family)
MPGKVVSPSEWLEARKDLLTKEKDLLRTTDTFNSQLRDFPMVKLDKEYIFEGPNGKLSLADLFEGRKQLIVYHFMLAPDAKACPGCSFLADHIPHLSHLNFRDTTFVAVSRAPIEEIGAFKKRMGWTFPWYSSYGSGFNYDFHVSLDESVTPVVYNYKDKEQMVKEGKKWQASGEQPGLSVFLREGEGVLHTYSTFARGLERILSTYGLLDITPLGRQEGDGMGAWSLHDEYGQEKGKEGCH